MNNKEKILKIMFEDPNKEFHIRLLARLTKLNPNTVINISEILTKEELITKHKSKETNLTIIKANTQNKFYKLKKQYYNVEKIHKSKLAEFLNEQLSYPTIILFGSYAKAENHKHSDIDLFVLSEKKKKLDLRAYEKILGAKIQIFLHTKQEFNELKKTNPELINNIINGYKLNGYLEAI